MSSIDLSIASPELATDVEWKVHDCLCRSDHFPITIADITDAEVQANPIYIMEKADWKLFAALTYTRESADDKDVNELVKVFSDLVISAAQQSIPQTKGTFTRRPVPWWNEQCTIANRERKRALRRYQRSKLVVDKVAYNRARAKARFVKRNSKRISWREYISGISSNTSAGKVWNRMNKVRGKYSPSPIPCLQQGGRIEMDSQKVADIEWLIITIE